MLLNHSCQPRPDLIAILLPWSRALYHHHWTAAIVQPSHIVTNVQGESIRCAHETLMHWDNIGLTRSTCSVWSEIFDLFKSVPRQPIEMRRALSPHTQSWHFASSPLTTKRIRRSIVWGLKISWVKTLRQEHNGAHTCVCGFLETLLAMVFFLRKMSSAWELTSYWETQSALTIGPRCQVCLRWVRRWARAYMSYLLLSWVLCWAMLHLNAGTVGMMLTH